MGEVKNLCKLDIHQYVHADQEGIRNFADVGGVGIEYIRDGSGNWYPSLPSLLTPRSIDTYPRRSHDSRAALRILWTPPNLPRLIRMFLAAPSALRASPKHRRPPRLPLLLRHGWQRLPFRRWRHSRRHVFGPRTQRANDDLHREPCMSHPHPRGISANQPRTVRRARTWSPDRWVHKPKCAVAVDVLGDADLVDAGVSVHLPLRARNLQPRSPPASGGPAPRLHRRPPLRAHRETLPLDPTHHRMVVSAAVPAAILRTYAAAPVYLHRHPPRRPLPLLPSLPPSLRKHPQLRPANNRPNIPRPLRGHDLRHPLRPLLGANPHTPNPAQQRHLRTRIPSSLRGPWRPPRPHRSILVLMDHLQNHPLDRAHHRVGALRRRHAARIQRGIHVPGGRVPAVRGERVGGKQFCPQQLRGGVPAVLERAV